MMGEEHIKIGILLQRAWKIVGRTKSRTAGVMSRCESVCRLCLTHIYGSLTFPSGNLHEKKSTHEISTQPRVHELK